LFIYVILCILTAILLRVFFSTVFQRGFFPEPSVLAGFFVIPAVLVILFVISLVRLIHNLVTRKTGRRFQIRLLGYFSAVLLFAVIPLVIVTAVSMSELLRFWNSLDIEFSMNYAERFAMDSYSFKMEKAEAMIANTDFERIYRNEYDAPPEILLAVQDFELVESAVSEANPEGRVWTDARFWGKADVRLDSPPSVGAGFVPRDKMRDVDVIRYVIPLDEYRIRLVTCDLGWGFDLATDSFSAQRAKFRTMDSLNINFFPLLFIFYAVFFLPTVLFTLILAISFTRNVTNPIIDLSEATVKVANGDFSIYIPVKRRDELGLLIKSFNTMVKDLDKSHNSLIKAEKISIWQQMAAQLAHEIKNPLTPIKLSAERVLRRWRFFKDSPDDEDSDPRALGAVIEASMLSIIQETDSLAAMLSEFRVFSRPMEPSKSSAKPLETASPLVDSYRLSYPDIAFIMDIDPSAEVKMDSRRLSQILTNLCVIAIDAVYFDAVEEGGGAREKRVEIRADRIRKQGAFFWRISVSDTGAGIPESAAPNVFTPYFTTKETGTGLGLPIVERIVGDHDGEVWFNSSVNVGTTFFVDIPSV
jgi:nitrogen fixation/metabolism regulation signal transduction histidine kinase